MYLSFLACLMGLVYSTFVKHNIYCLFVELIVFLFIIKMLILLIFKIDEKYLCDIDSFLSLKTKMMRSIDFYVYFGSDLSINKLAVKRNFFIILC